MYISLSLTINFMQQEIRISFPLKIIISIVESVIH